MKERACLRVLCPRGRAVFRFFSRLAYVPQVWHLVIACMMSISRPALAVMHLSPTALRLRLEHRETGYVSWTLCFSCFQTIAKVSSTLRVTAILHSFYSVFEKYSRRFALSHVLSSTVGGFCERQKSSSKNIDMFWEQPPHCRQADDLD